MTLRGDTPRRKRPSPTSKWTIPIIVVSASAVLVFVGIVLAMSGQSFF